MIAKVNCRRAGKYPRKVRRENAKAKLLECKWALNSFCIKVFLVKNIESVSGYDNMEIVKFKKQPPFIMIFSKARNVPFDSKKINLLFSVADST